MVSGLLMQRITLPEWCPAHRPEWGPAMLVMGAVALKDLETVCAGVVFGTSSCSEQRGNDAWWHHQVSHIARGGDERTVPHCICVSTAPLKRVLLLLLLIILLCGMIFGPVESPSEEMYSY